MVVWYLWADSLVLAIPSNQGILAQRYQTTLSAVILLAEVVGWERDYKMRLLWCSEYDCIPLPAIVAILLVAINEVNRLLVLCRRRLDMANRRLPFR